MEGPSAEQTAIDIGQLHVNMDTCHNSLSFMSSHAVTLAQCFEVGKCPIVKVLKRGVEMNKQDVL